MDSEEGRVSARNPLVPTRTDREQVTRQLAELPMLSAEQYQHIGRFSGAVVMSVFEQIGGAPRMAVWADQNPTDFFTKLFPKMIARSQHVDVSGTLTIDDAISRLERMDEGDYDEVRTITPEPHYDL
jgi:hypothetical protein